MAFASKLFSIIFIAALFSSLFSHIEARASTQSYFFSKNTRGTGNQIEEPLDEQVEQLSSPPFRPGSQQETIGEEFGESQATAARPFSEENNGFNNNFYQNNKAADPNQQGSWFNNDRFYHQTTTTNNGAQKYNQFDANTFPDHRNEFQFPGQQKQQQQPQQQQKQEQELQTQGFEFQDQQKKPQQQTQVVGGQGMSDTRKMFNGAYFYDINQDLDKQKNSVNRFYQEAANNGGGGGRFNYNRFQFHKQAEEEEFEP